MGGKDISILSCCFVLNKLSYEVPVTLQSGLPFGCNKRLHHVIFHLEIQPLKFHLIAARSLSPNRAQHHAVASILRTPPFSTLRVGKAAALQRRHLRFLHRSDDDSGLRFETPISIGVMFSANIGILGILK